MEHFGFERDRSIFRDCYRTFLQCHRSLDMHAFRHSRKREQRIEYMADFTLIARRTLPSPDYRIFDYVFLRGESATLSAARFGLDLTDFLLLISGIEARLGRAFAETEPHALYPCAAYFSERAAA